METATASPSSNVIPSPISIPTAMRRRLARQTISPPMLMRAAARASPLKACSPTSGDSQPPRSKRKRSTFPPIAPNNPTQRSQRLARCAAATGHDPLRAYHPVGVFRCRLFRVARLDHGGIKPTGRCRPGRRLQRSRGQESQFPRLSVSYMQNPFDQCEGPLERLGARRLGAFNRSQRGASRASEGAVKSDPLVPEHHPDPDPCVRLSRFLRILRWASVYSSCGWTSRKFLV